MIISKVIGGLGNQLFQIAAARNLAIELNQELYLDITFFDEWEDPDVYRIEKYNIDYKIADPADVKRLQRVNSTGLVYKGLRKIFKKPFYLNAQNHYDPRRLGKVIKGGYDQLKVIDDIFMEGYFADPIFFQKHFDKIAEELTLKNELNSENKKVLSEIDTSNSVSLHIRRGDYINNTFFANLPMSYYIDSASEILEKVENPVFFIFSDDLDWAKKNLDIKADLKFVDINDRHTDYMELNLMSSCKHNIIANSTFSWWGAWMNRSPEKMVFAPNLWYNDKKAQQNYLSKKSYQKGWKRI